MIMEDNRNSTNCYSIIVTVTITTKKLKLIIITSVKYGKSEKSSLIVIIIVPAKILQKS